mgnify:CR=1 FL=1
MNRMNRDCEIQSSIYKSGSDSELDADEKVNKKVNKLKTMPRWKSARPTSVMILGKREEGA